MKVFLLFIAFFGLLFGRIHRDVNHYISYNDKGLWLEQTLNINEDDSSVLELRDGNGEFIIFNVKKLTPNIIAVIKKDPEKSLEVLESSFKKKYIDVMKRNRIVCKTPITFEDQIKANYIFLEGEDKFHAGLLTFIKDNYFIVILYDQGSVTNLLRNQMKCSLESTEEFTLKKLKEIYKDLIVH